MFFPELHEVRGLGDQILQRGRKEHKIPQPTPEVPGGVTALRAPRQGLAESSCVKGLA